MKWEVPVTIVEYHRIAVVEADTKAEARRLARDANWELLCTDAKRYTVMVVGAAVPSEEFK